MAAAKFAPVKESGFVAWVSCERDRLRPELWRNCLDARGWMPKTSHACVKGLTLISMVHRM